uniref:Uncharacterized protein n=1 Tax=Nelumbo nucifera TaxID=4432 RepID=A0A822ZVW1_NELNU|nr:TPA_asm: hypothetical protein HUJ06_004288 [Nelumbo nucifera]
MDSWEDGEREREGSEKEGGVVPLLLSPLPSPPLSSSVPDHFRFNHLLPNRSIGRRR